MPPTQFKVTILNYVERWRYEQLGEVHTENMGAPWNEHMSRQAEKNGFIVMATHDSVPGAQLIKFTTDSDLTHYALATVEEVEPVKDGIALVPDYHALFTAFLRDADIFARALRNAKVGEEPTRREQDMHSFISRVSVCASSMTSMEEIEQLRAVLALCAENLNHAETIMEGDEDLSDVRP